MSADDLIVYLRREPSPEEHALIEAIGRSNGDPVPFHMFAKVAVRSDRHGEWIGGVEATKKWIRRHSRAALGYLLANLLVGAGFLLHNASENGAAAERAAQVEQRSAREAQWAQERRESMEREIQDLRNQLVEVRAAMRRMSGVDPASPSGDYRDMFPDKLSYLRGPSCTLASPSFSFLP